MQSPTASDPSFKTFLEDLQKQNNQSFVTQIFQLKAEREIAGKDGDKREEQLHEINETLKTLKGAITGIKLDAPAIDFTPVVDSLSNVTEVLLKSLEEHSVLRKISEGRVKFDADTQRYHLEGKEAKNKMVKEADVRTTSTKDAMAAPVATRNRGPVNSKDLKIQGKVSEDASVEDIAAARGSVGPDRGSDLTDPALRLKPIKYTPGKATAVAVKGGKDKPADDTDDDLEKTKYQGFFNEIKSGFKFFMSNGLSEKPGYGAFQEPPKDVEKKEREAKVSSPRQENPEGDNVITTGEIEADAAKSDLELSKQMLDTTREQLTVLKEIRDALAPKTPRELTEQKGAPSSTTEKEKEGGGSLLGDLASGAVDMLGKGKGIAGKAAGMGGKILGGLGKAARFLGPAAAVAGAAYSGVQGYQNTGANFDLKEGEDATVGQKTASTLGGVASGLTFGLLDEKSASQGIHKAGSAVGNFFGGIGDKVKGAYGDAKETAEQAKNFVGDTAYTVGATAGANIDRYTGIGKQVGKAKEFLGIKPDTSQVSDAEGTKTFDKEGNLIKQASPTFAGVSTETDVRTGDVTSKYSQGPMALAQTKFAAGGSQSTGSYDLGPAIVKTRKTLTAKQQAEADLASGITPEAKSVTPKEAIDGKPATVAAQPKSLDEIAMAEAKKYGRDTPNIDDKKAARLLAANANNAGKMVAQTSTENADMGREAGKGGANNTVVSNNVSSNNTTKIVPMKANPRPEYTGSALDRYTSRIAVY